MWIFVKELAYFWGVDIEQEIRESLIVIFYVVSLMFIIIRELSK